MSIGGYCNFCSAEPVWDELVRDVDITIPTIVRSGKLFTRVSLEVDGRVRGRSTAAWAACHTCHCLIHEGDRRGLLIRAAKAMKQLQPESRELLHAGAMTDQDLHDSIKTMHDAFWETRSGVFTLRQP